MIQNASVRTIALLEAAKGLVVLLTGAGIFLLIHRDVQTIAEQVVAHSHLNPASHYPRIFLQLAAESTPGRLHLLALGALLYATMRFIEAFGLWRDRPWAEWFGTTTATIYLPFELIALIRRPSLDPLIALVVTVGIALVLGIRLWQRREATLARA